MSRQKLAEKAYELREKAKELDAEICTNISNEKRYLLRKERNALWDEARILNEKAKMTFNGWQYIDNTGLANMG